MIQQYPGPYVITPSESVRSLQTTGRSLRQNVIVSPIPADYVGSKVKRKGATTVTPTEHEQIAVKKGTYVTGDIKVGPSAQEPDAEYTLGTDERVAMVGADKYWRVKPKINVTQEGHVDSGEVIGTGGSAYPYIDATTITPTKNTQTVGANGSYMGGAVTVDPIPDSYFDMTGANAWMGAGAELVTTFTMADVKLSATSYASWTPSTTASDILATRNAGTFVADLENYDYYLVWETGIPVVVPASTTKKSLPIFTAAYQVQQLFRRPSSFAQIEAGTYSAAACISAYTNNFIRYYGTTQNSATYSWGLSYALYATLTAATFSSTSSDNPTVTVKSPKVSARCSSTYMSTTSAAAIDQTNTIISQKCLVYRVKKQTGFIRGVYEGNVAFINELIGD